MRLYAAGSLRAALDERRCCVQGWEVQAVYGASGLLRERIAKGEPAEVFASANMARRTSRSRSARVRS